MQHAHLLDLLRRLQCAEKRDEKNEHEASKKERPHLLTAPVNAHAQYECGRMSERSTFLAQE